MREIKSSVLTVDIDRALADELGADWCSSPQEALSKGPSGLAYPVLILGVTPKNSTSTQQLISQIPLRSKVIFVVHELNSEQLRQTLRQRTPYAIAPIEQTGKISELMKKALTDFQQQDQDSQLLQLFETQNEKLRKLSLDLESRVERREQSLKKAHEKLLTQSARLEGLLRALMAMQKAQSLAEMEQLLKSALKFILNISSVKIHVRSSLSQQVASGTIYSADLILEGRSLGQITYTREQSPFSRDEGVFLDQVTSTVALAMDRLAKLALVESLKAQWEATFNAISHALCLVDENYELVRYNDGYAKRTVNKESSKCHKRLFNRTSPCPGCSLGKSFELNDENKTFAVFSQAINPSGHFLVLYRDITEERQLEKQIFESAKLAEMGTIGSSIAHELNNPLGGMISFLQLIRSDLQGREPYFEDIVEMEKGAQRCKEIVQNLLGFTRKQEDELPEVFDLREAIAQALKITELQTRSKGIHVEAVWGSEPALVSGHVKLLAQALCHLMQNSAEAIQQRFGKAQLSSGQIAIELNHVKSNFTIAITDNGARDIGIPEMGVSLAQQLIKVHGGEMHVQKDQKLKDQTQVIIQIPKVS